MKDPVHTFTGMFAEGGRQHGTRLPTPRIAGLILTTTSSATHSKNPVKPILPTCSASLNWRALLPSWKKLAPAVLYLLPLALIS